MYHQVELHEGDIVYVMEKCDDGWFVGTSQRTGETARLKKTFIILLVFRNLRNFPRQLCDTDIAMAGRGNLTLATVQSAAPHTLTLTKDFPPNHRLVRLTSQLSPTTNTAMAPSFGSPDFVTRLAWLPL